MNRGGRLIERGDFPSLARAPHFYFVLRPTNYIPRASSRWSSWGLLAEHLKPLRKWPLHPQKGTCLGTKNGETEGVPWLSLTFLSWTPLPTLAVEWLTNFQITRSPNSAVILFYISALPALIPVLLSLLLGYKSICVRACPQKCSFGPSALKKFMMGSSWWAISLKW